MFNKLHHCLASFLKERLIHNQYFSKKINVRYDVFVIKSTSSVSLNIYVEQYSYKYTIEKNYLQSLTSRQLHDPFTKIDGSCKQQRQIH